MGYKQAMVQKNPMQNIMRISQTGKTGYLFDIDGVFPDDVHDYLNEYCPLPENKAHQPSPYMVASVKEIQLKAKPEVKLVCALSPKEHYVVHYAELQSAIRKGFKVTKVHKVIKFKQ